MSRCDVTLTVCSAGLRSPAALPSPAAGRRCSSEQEASSSLGFLLLSYWSPSYNTNQPVRELWANQDGGPGLVVPVGRQVVQAGSDVMFVEVDLLAVEAALLLQPAERLTKFLKLRPPTLAPQALLPDVLIGQSGFSLLIRTNVASCSPYR